MCEKTNEPRESPGVMSENVGGDEARTIRNEEEGTRIGEGTSYAADPDNEQTLGGEEMHARTSQVESLKASGENNPTIGDDSGSEAKSKRDETKANKAMGQQFEEGTN